MRISNPLLPSVSEGVQVDELALDADALTITDRTTAARAACPHCGLWSARVHSSYWRTLKDLPWQDRSVTWRVKVRRFRCSHCPGRIFAEPVPCLARARAQRSDRLAEAQTDNGMALGGEAGARLSRRLAMPVNAGSLRYFKTVADKVGGGVEAWGLIAAVLGNASNRFAFREAAWMDPDQGLRTYLAEVAGSPQWIEEPDPSAPGKVRKRRPLVVDREGPPRNRTEALKRWQDARAAFQTEMAKVRNFLAEIEAARKEVGTLPELRSAAQRASRAVDAAEEAAAAAKQDHQESLTEASRTKQARERAQQAMDAHQARRPGFLARTFGTRSARDWSTSNGQLGAVLERADREAGEAAARYASAQGRHGAAEKSRKAVDSEFQQAVAIRDLAEERVALMRRRCGARAVDAAFFARDREVLHLAAPWLDGAAHRERNRVFELALAVHKAFIDAAAVPVRSNLENLFKALIGRNAWQPKTRPHMPDLWATLFLVVPVISTTFA